MTELRPPADAVARRSSWLLEAAVIAVVLVIGIVLGVRIVQTYRAAGFRPSFYQSAFGPAVMMACGHGFRNPDLAAIPSLNAFLTEQSDRFDCAALPSSAPTLPLSNFQGASRYLEMSMAIVWAIFGVSWSSAALLCGTMFGIVAALTYGILRLALSRPFAIAFLVPAATSTPGIDLVPQLRDYSKGPFLLAVVLILGCLVVCRMGRLRVISLAILAGAVVGTGLGFRTDLALAVVPTVVVLSILLPMQIRAVDRLLAIALFLAAFAVTGFPILRGYAAGGNTGHVVLLGLASEFDRPLRIEPSIYEFAAQYNDTLAFSIINSYAIRSGGWPNGVKLESREYEQAAREYLTQLARVFPADLSGRVLAAIRVIPRYFLDTSLSPPAQAASSPVRAIYRVRASIWSRLAPFCWPALIATAIALAALEPRAGWLVIVVLVGFGGASALQFHERHFYYLQFVPWFVFGLVAETAIRRRDRFATVSTALGRGLVLAAAVALVVVAARFAATGYQQRTVTRLFSGYENASRTPIEIAATPAGANRRLLTTRDWANAMRGDARWIETHVVAVEFDDARCAPSVPITIRYSAEVADADLSEDMVIPLRSGAAMPTRVFIPTFDRADETIRFRGLEIADDRARCITNVAAVRGLEQTPLLLTARLGEGWRGENLFERFKR